MYLLKVRKRSAFFFRWFSTVYTGTEEECYAESNKYDSNIYDIRVVNSQHFI